MNHIPPARPRAAERLSPSDVRLLRILQQGANLTYAELADRAGLSPSACSRHINQLRQDGVITGWVALLDRRRVGLNVVSFVEVQLDRHSEAIDRAFRTAVLREPEVAACYVTTGPCDYLLKVVAPDIPAYAEFTMQRLLRMPGVRDIRSSVVLGVVKDSPALPLDHLE